MCGYAGFVEQKPVLSVKQKKEILNGMGRQLAFRGPDEETFYMDKRLSLAFRRLSIVDLKGGSQPIWNENRDLLVVVNGEIYNHLELRKRLKDKHQFRSKSDSEIVVHLYEELGPNCLDLLNGIFSIVVWDAKTKTLFLARDRLGVKPLFYTHLYSTFLFGSELKAILMHPDTSREMNFFGYVDPDESILAGVKPLPGGHYAILSGDGRLQITKYWSVEEYFPQENLNILKTSEENIEKYRSVLEDAVQKQLMSDVPIGFFLSGGLDSAMITTIARKFTSEVKAFNILVPDMLESGDAEAAVKLAKEKDLELIQCAFDEKTFESVSLKDLEYLIWRMEAPFLNDEIVYKLETYRFAKEVDSRIKVVLIGQGADEFSGGYTKDTTWTKESIHHLFSEWGEFVKSYTFSTINFSGLQGIFHEDFRLGTKGLFIYFFKQYRSNLQKYNLWHEDLTSSSQGVEARVPFLDHRLVEILLSVPDSLRSELFWDKTILRKVASKWLPQDLAWRPKVGFIKGAEATGLNFRKQLILKVFPDFCEKYLTTSNSILSKEFLLALHKRILENMEAGKESFSLVRALSLAMMIGVFDAMIKKPEEFIRSHPSKIANMRIL